MKKQTAKKILSLFIISIFLMQAVLPSTVLADNQALNYDNPNKNGDNPYKLSLNGIISSGLLTNLVGCTGIVDKVSKVTVQFAQKILSKKKEKIATKKDATTQQNSSVPSIDSSNLEKEVETKQEVKDAADSKAFTENCLKGIAITLAKNQLTAMTKYTMNWITTGFNGDPLYVRDVNSYMDSLTTGILKKETEIFGNIDNEKYYPYGRDYARGQINAYKVGKDQYGALKQDLTNYLEPGATIEDFANDFSVGSENGWGGWLALTQRPQNNPLGFNLEATKNLENQKTVATSNAQNELNRNGGVFDQKKCIEYAPVAPTRTTGTDSCGIKDRKGNCLGTPSGGNTTSATAVPRCLKYETVTPGSVIKAKIDTYINSPERQIELADTLNDALNSLFSALINKFESQGLSGLGSKVNNWTTPAGGGFGSNSLVDTLGNTLSSTGVFGEETGGNQVSASFDLTKDLGNKYAQPIDSGTWDANTNTPEILPDTGIKNQYYTVSVSGNTRLFAGTHTWHVGEKVYYDGKKWNLGLPKHIIDKKGVFQLQKDYMKSITKTVAVLPQVLPKLSELDYCIPGPNTNWVSNSDEARNEYFAYLSGVTTEHISDIFNCNAPLDPSGIVCGIGSIFASYDHSYDVISYPDYTNYQKLFDDARNLWPKIEVHQSFWIAHNDRRQTYGIGTNHWYVDPAYVEAQVTRWTDAAKRAYDEYVVKVNDKFGINSPMRTEFTPQGNYNPAFLPMAQAGLDMTKNIVTDAEDLPGAIDTAKDNFAQTSGAIYRLGFIKDKVNVIITAAQNRRKTRRANDGLPAMPQICLDNEKVTWVENDVLKY